MKPLIGVTCNYMEAIPATVEEGIAAPGQDWHLLAADYVRSVERAGGAALLLPMTADEAVIARYAGLCDGFLITGGNDISPELYGEKAEHCGKLLPERDRFDLALTARVLTETDKPLFGVCRGCQIVGVALGGTLWQHLPAAGYENHALLSVPRELPSHAVTTTDGSLLQRVTGLQTLHVNSFHHQAVRTPGRGVISARSGDGVIEAVELGTERFFLGVQWHPEMMGGDAVQQKLFSAFIRASGGA